MKVLSKQQIHLRSCHAGVSSLNGIELSYFQQELSEIVLKLASGERDYDELLRWLILHQKG